MQTPEGYINFECYEDAVRFCGLVSVQLPDISNLVQSINGAGISGNIDAVLIGMIDAMTLTMNFRTVTEDTINLTVPGPHNIDLRAAQQIQDNTTGDKEVVADKYSMVVEPKSTSLGSIAPASTGDASGEYAVRSFKMFKNGTRVIYLDQLNNICEYMGVDYAKPVRKALGLT